MRHRYSILLFPLHIFVDVVCMNAAFVGAYWIKFGTVAPLVRPPYVMLWCVFNLAWLLIVTITKPYTFPRQLFKADHLLRKLVVLVAIHIAVIAVYWVSVQGVYYSREHLLFTYIGFFGCRGYGSARRVTVSPGIPGQGV